MAASSAMAEPDRHAIELRISAEDPARAFAPMPGRIGRWREPAGPGVRIDSGVVEGMTVSGDYDPMLSKILVVAADRESAIRRARRAVAEMETGGIQTTVPFHAWLLRHPAFVAGEVRTDLVDRDWDPTGLREAAARRAIATVAQLIHRDESPPELSDPVRRAATPPPVTSGWAQTARREATERWP